jgi:Fe-S cluster assembly protein SufB
VSRIDKDFVKKLSQDKNEPDWMCAYRQKAVDIFRQSSLPDWVPSEKLRTLDLESLKYYIKPTSSTESDWEAVPGDIKKKYEDLGIPEDERRFLAGVGAQYESEMVYHAIKKDFADKGVYFADMGTALLERPDLVHKYFGQLISLHNNKFAALNGAVWSGGSFIYIPRGVYLKQPLHNFFQMGKPAQGQFERTIIVAEENSFVEFIEGCIAPRYSKVSIHAGVVEVFVEKNAEVKFTTLQNWSKNVWNLVTKRARVKAGGVVDWMDGNVGSGITMKYPRLDLVGKKASGRVSSLVFADTDQIMDTGAKVFHLAPQTKSIIESRSVLKGGQSTFRGQVYVDSKADNSMSSIDCASLMMDSGLVNKGCGSRSGAEGSAGAGIGARTGDGEDTCAGARAGCGGFSSTKPYLRNKSDSSSIEHESSLFRFKDEQKLYLYSRGFDDAEARSVMVGGFVQPFIQDLPMEYAVEFNRLIELELQGNESN